MWKYDPGENPKRKHAWAKDYADHIQVGDRLVGKCPKSITNERAEQALNHGFFYFSERSSDQNYPERIFAVIDGVVYRAMPTVRGVSYHGFPERAVDLPPGREVREALLDLAEADGSRKAVARWLKS